ncbi:MAG: phosphoenolpyruvate--protein phosphotransferase [Candidatus Aureabacteria bacterium]|nr:phosphoenolpyruvate--protein phosphotransferase [Candidatus Auribacterota bacterium]
MRKKAKKSSQLDQIIYYGIPVSEGVVIGNVYKFDSGISKPILERNIRKSEIASEVLKFENALIQTRKELLEIQTKIAEAMGSDHADIFNAHLLVLEDSTIMEEVTKRIQHELKNAEFIFSDVMKQFTKVFSEMQDEYLRERISDIKDVTRRILRNIKGEKKQDLTQIKEEVVVIAYDLSPSDTVLMHKENVVGFATDIGGKTSHTAIMARSLGIPAVVGLHDVSRRIPLGSTVILDGTKGLLIVNPVSDTLKKYSDTKSLIEIYEENLKSLKNIETVTKDGRKIELHSNIEMPEDIQSLLSHGALGVGLYRTEFCYMNRTDLPSEDELFHVYSKVVRKMNPKPVVIRTMDMGGDKFLSHLKLPVELNPFMGWRAIRFCLERIDIFKTQMRAILRASAFGKTKIMYPMISNLNEVIQANSILKKCMKELKNEHLDYDENIEIGIMIEIPSAAITSHFLANHVQFFSIGTNDLIQYTLAVDRINERIAYLYQPFHPGVLRLIQMVVQAASKNKVDVSVCGEMAGDPAGAIILVGMGITKLSLSSMFIPKIKSILRAITYAEAEDLVNKTMHCSQAVEIKELVDPIIKRVVPNFVNETVL